MSNLVLILLSVIATFAAGMLVTKNPAFSFFLIVVDGVIFYILLHGAFIMGII